jgi:hypothetical protein
MRINDLDKYGAEELNLFRMLSTTEKIAFVDSVCKTGITDTITQLLEENESDLPLMVQSIDFKGLGVLHNVVYYEEMYIYSNSLKAIRLYIRKMFEDGNLLSKMPTKKPKEISERYYYAYKILPNVTPLCLN